MLTKNTLKSITLLTTLSLVLAACNSDKDAEEKAKTNAQATKPAEQAQTVAETPVETPIEAPATISQWRVDNDQSELGFSSVKNGDIKENHRFTLFTGELNANGEFTLEIDLNSVDTNIEIRDQRMKEHLFKTEQNPTATLTGTIDSSLLQQSAPFEHTLDATLNYADKSVPVQTQVIIERLSDNSIQVSNPQALTISAVDLGLDAGLNQLQQIAGLASIDMNVPVTFRIVLVGQ